MLTATEARALEISTKCAPLIKLLATGRCSVTTAAGKGLQFRRIAQAEAWLVANGYVTIDQTP